MCDVAMCDGLAVEELPNGSIICARCRADERRREREGWVKEVLVPPLVAAVVLAATVCVLALQQ